jgi:hypothetical protein
MVQWEGEDVERLRPAQKSGKDDYVPLAIGHRHRVVTSSRYHIVAQEVLFLYFSFYDSIFTLYIISHHCYDTAVPANPHLFA